MNAWRGGGRQIFVGLFLFVKLTWFYFNMPGAIDKPACLGYNFMMSETQSQPDEVEVQPAPTPAAPVQQSQLQPAPVAPVAPTAPVAPEVAERPLDSEAAEAYGRLQYVIAERERSGMSSILTATQFEAIRAASNNPDPVNGYGTCLLSVVMNMNEKEFQRAEKDDPASLKQLVDSVKAGEAFFRKLAGKSREAFLAIVVRVNPDLAPNGIEALIQDQVGSQRAVQWAQQQFQGVMAKFEEPKAEVQNPGESVNEAVDEAA